MRIKRSLVLAFLLVLYIGPVIFIASYASPTIPTDVHMTKDFSIASEWYDESWHYRKEVTIATIAEAGYNYTVQIPVTYDSDMQADFDDIRFTDNDMITDLDYWRESYIASTSAVFWVEIADELSTWPISVDIYMYYGNSTVSTTSNGTATFPYLYEDWADESVDAGVWTTIDNAGSISWDSTDANHGTVAKIEGSAGTGKQGYDSVASGVAPTALMFRANIEKTVAASQNIRIGATPLSAHGFSVIQTSAGAQTFYVYDDDSVQDTQTMDDAHFGAYHTWQITRDGTYTKLYVDNVLDETASWDPDIKDQAYVMMSVTDSEYDLYVDWVAVRKFVIDEPYFDNFGEEENNLPPPEWDIINIAILLFTVLYDPWAVNVLLIFCGLGMIPVSVIYLVWGGKNGMSMDKVFYGIVVFIFGWALFLGGIGG